MTNGNDGPNLQAEINENEAKRLLHKTETEPDQPQNQSSQSSGGAWTQINIGMGEGSRAKSTNRLTEKLPSLPPSMHPFRDPQHSILLKRLRDDRILILTSYRERAAYAAAHALVNDTWFLDRDRRALFPTRGRDRDRSDLDLLALSDEEFFGEKPQVLLIEINKGCPLLDSALQPENGGLGRLCDALEHHSSYLVLSIDEDLFAKDAADGVIPHHSVSHLRYLFARDLIDRAEDLERRFMDALARSAGAMDLQELYKRIADRLAQGPEAFENLLRELEEAHGLPLAERKQRLQPISAHKIFDDGSEVHRAAAFVATYFPEIAQCDFDRFVLTLLGRQTTTVERVRQTLGTDGTVITVREETEQRWSERWERSPDQVFLDCHLRTIVAADGSWVVDFSEPYLRRELRAHLEGHYPWYLRRQCRTLQDSGILFALDLSAAAVEGLVQLFVERAVVDPVGFGGVWLLDLVGGLKIQLKGEPPPGLPEAALVWLLETLAAEAQLRAHFYGRLALLIREMLDREALRPMVRDFFEFLIAARQHDALLDLVLELARRLRFAPHFDPLVWMRRLLDQGSTAVQERTVNRLISLARDSGPRIYEFLAAIRSWLPEAGRPSERFSISNQVALELPFAYCLHIARWLPGRQMGVWPSRHPLFHALAPPDTIEARREIANLIDWILDPRGAALETADKSDPTRPAEAVRIGCVADLVEHWSWVLDNGTVDGAPEGRVLFQVILEETAQQIGARERAWLLRSWSRRQDEYLTQVTEAEGAGRTILGRRRARLDQLKRRLSELAAQRQAGAMTPTKTGEMTP